MINRFFIFLIKIYKKYLSKGLNSGCIFTPTCSEYAMEAFEKRMKLKKQTDPTENEI